MPYCLQEPHLVVRDKSPPQPAEDVQSLGVVETECKWVLASVDSYLTEMWFSICRYRSICKFCIKEMFDKMHKSCLKQSAVVLLQWK